MSNKNKIYNLIILDESGSMESVKDATIQGFNELIQAVQSESAKIPDLQHFLQLFSSTATELSSRFHCNE